MAASGACTPSSGDVCYGHGTCSADDGGAYACVCDLGWFGRTCGESFYELQGEAYIIWLAVTGALFLGLALLMVRYLVGRIRGRNWSTTPFTVREWCVAANFLCVILRLVWLVDPKGIGVYTRGVSETLLRLPQQGWLASILAVILVWNSLIQSAQNKKVSHRVRCCLMSVALVFLLVTVPLIVMAAGGLEVVAGVVNLVSGAYVFVVMIAGVVYGRRLLALLNHHAGNAAVQSVIRTVRLTVNLSVTLSIIVVVFVVLERQLRWLALSGDRGDPHGNLVFMFVIHPVCEWSFASLMYWTASTVVTRRDRDQASFTGSPGRAPAREESHLGAYGEQIDNDGVHVMNPVANVGTGGLDESETESDMEPV